MMVYSYNIVETVRVAAVFHSNVSICGVLHYSQRSHRSKEAAIQNQ